MFGIFANLLMMCVLPTYVRSTATGANCTIVEWNIGIYGFFSQDFKFVPQGTFDVIRIIAFFDLDFQSTWNTTVNARWGPSFYIRSQMNPCLRFRPLIIDAPNGLTTEYMKSQVNSFWTFGAMTVDVLVFLDNMPAANVLHSGVNGKVSIGTSNSLIYNQKDLYPFLFRYSNSVDEEIKAAYRYFVRFSWRSIAMVYGESREELATFQFFLELFNADLRSPTVVTSYNLPSETFPYRKATIQTMIKTIAASTPRLLYVNLKQGAKFAEDPHCHPLPFSICVLQDMRNFNVTGSSFQFLVNEPMVRTAYFAPGWGPQSMYTEGFHHIQGFAVQLDDANFPWLMQLAGNLWYRMKPSDYADAYTRYAINQWSNDTWKPYWEEKVLQGQALTGIAEAGYDNLAMAKLGDMLTFILHALNDVMNKYQPVSKSQVTAKMIADAMSVSSPPWTTYMGPMPFTMSYPSQELVAPAIIVQRFDHLHPQNSQLELPICCNGSYYRGATWVYDDQIPIWGTGNASEVPPPSLWNCTPGQIMLSDGVCEWCPAGRFSNMTDQTECIWCPPGKAAPEKSTVCEDCDIGKAASERQMKHCVNCIPGTYASSKAQSQCISCALGKYSSSMAATVCLDCGGDLTTASKGALTPAGCVCAMGTFSRDFQTPNSSSGKVTSCEACMKGLDCETDWPNSWNAIGNPISSAQPGFYTSNSAPYETYKCCFGNQCKEDCPGGPPEACASGRTGLVCDLCLEDDYIINGATCERCSFLANQIIVIIVIVTSVLCFATYYLSNGRLTVDADNPLAMLLFLGLLVTVAQIFGVVKDLNIPWPKSLKGFMSGSSAAFSLDANDIPLQCALGSWAVALYMVQVLFPGFLLVEIFSLCAGSKLIARLLKNPSIPWEINKTLNVGGQVMQLLFIAFCGIMVKPLQCFQHPNGKRSLKMYPRVLCDEGGDHSSLLLLAACICFGFLLPFIAWCVWGCVKAPSESSNANAGFLQRYRFLLYRFRPDCWWWGLVFMLRQITLAFATVLLLEHPHGQLFYTSAILAVYGFHVCRFWPWISGELSFIDAVTMLGMVLIMLAASQYLPEAEDNKGRAGILVSLYVFMGVLFLRYIVFVAKSTYTNGIFGEFSIGSEDRVETCKLWLKWLEYAQSVSNLDVAEIVCKMNVFDRIAILNLMSSWNAASGKGVTGNKMRLKCVPSRISVNKEQTSMISRESSRLEEPRSMEPLGLSCNMSSFDQGSDSIASIVESKVGIDSEMCMI